MTSELKSLGSQKIKTEASIKDISTLDKILAFFYDFIFYAFILDDPIQIRIKIPNKALMRENVEHLS